jgi:hypothetical protein
MTDIESPLERALKLTLALFPPGPARPEDIAKNSNDVLSLLQLRGEMMPDAQTLIREVEAKVVVWQERSTSLEDRTGHDDWLATAKSQISWSFWDRYRRYLEQVELLPPAVISRLDESTFRVLEQLERPTRSGEWDRRALVVGHVQSGKTSHYTSLACKAADAGYKLIVVLTGTHDSLRSQTQLRLDQGLLGFDTQFQSRTDEDKQARIGVGALPGAEQLKIGSITSSLQKGDFTKVRAQNFTVPIGEMPILLVIKKYGSILDNLLEWVTKLHGMPVSADSEEKRVPEIPLLVIDDEADNASINTKNADQSPTAINGKIRSLLKAFDKSAYVGYTATPFANIYSSKSEDSKFGLDLFPRHFIENLKAPSNYFGPTRVFGLDAADDDEERPPLPIFRDIQDYSAWIPDGHKQSWRPNPSHFPQSLKEAIHAFFLVCAARRARGQETKHNSMLIHTTRYQLVQAEVAEQVEDYVRTSGYRLRYGDGNADSIWEELKKMWLDHFQPTSAQWPSKVEPLSWDDLRPHVTQAVDKIQMRTINGTSNDALEYYDNRKTGLSVIAIGGDKLSRGLTLEGLSVSYYLRATKMYDTLMQMGRWFGYRPGYEDLCRLYTTTTLRDWYREITAASEELRADFDDMAEKKGTPEAYGLRVRQSAAGLSVTAPSKMRSAKTITMTFSGDLSESVTFRVEDDTVSRNKKNFEQFVSRLRNDSDLTYTAAGKDNGMRGNYVWGGVPGAAVAEFFEGYQGDPMALRAKPQLLSGYIREGVDRGELADWTVVLVNSSTPQNKKQVAGLEVGLTVRTPLNGIDEVQASKRYTIRRVLSPSDESLDLSDEQYVAAMVALRDELREKEAQQGKKFKDPEHPRGATLRAQRTADRGLLLLYPLDDIDEDGHRIASDLLVGFAVSFPFSTTKLTAKYKVNETWFKQMLDEMPDDDGDDENGD